MQHLQEDGIHPRGYAVTQRNLFMLLHNCIKLYAPMLLCDGLVTVCKSKFLTKGRITFLRRNMTLEVMLKYLFHHR